MRKKADDDTGHKKSAYLGLDVGAASLVLVLIDNNETILDSSYCLVSEESGFSVGAGPSACAKTCTDCSHPCNTFFIIKKTNGFISTCCKKFNVEIKGFGTTGSQVREKTSFKIPLDMLVSEIAAHGRGMHRASNTENIQAIVDVGGQDSKVIKLSHPLEFHMSGLCAAGTGAYLDEISKVENLDVEEFGRLGGQYIQKYIDSFNSDNPLKIEEFSSVCTVFTKSSYVKKKSQLTLEERAAAICWAQGKQIYNTVIHNLRGYCGKISFQGGVSFNLGVRLALDHFFKEGQGLTADDESVLIVPEIKGYCDEEGHLKPVSHLMGALGAALLGKEYMEISQNEQDLEKICPSLEASRLRKDFLKKQIHLASEEGPSKPKVAWTGTLFSSEICYLFDIVPIALPVLAAIDHKNARSHLLTAAKEEGLGRANCTILSAVMGRLDETPPPDFIFHTSGSCDYYRQHMLSLTDAAQKRFGIDPEKQVSSIDLPTFIYDNDLGVRFVADQLRRAVVKIEDTLGVRHDPEKLREIVKNTNQARHYHLLTEKLRAENPALAYGAELLKRAVLYSSGWGSREFTEITRSCYCELKERARSLSSGSSPLFKLGEKHRLLWVYIWDFNDPKFFTHLENELSCAIVAEELNYIHWPPMDPDHPYESIARRIMQPINHLNTRMAHLMEMAKEYQVDGIIFFVHFFAHCPLASESIQDLLRKSGYPVLFLEGDALDQTRQPSSMTTKIQAFVEQLNEMKYGNIFGVQGDETAPAGSLKPSMGQRDSLQNHFLVN